MVIVIEVNVDAIKGKYVVITLLNNHRIFGWVKNVVEGIIILQISRIGKINSVKIKDILVIEDDLLAKTKREFWLM